MAAERRTRQPEQYRLAVPISSRIGFLPLFDPGECAKRVRSVWRKATPSLRYSINEQLGVVVQSEGQISLAWVEPVAFNRAQLQRAGQQPERHDVDRHNRLVILVPIRTVERHQAMLVRATVCREMDQDIVNASVKTAARIKPAPHPEAAIGRLV